MLVYCTEPSRRVPRESGVRFSIGSNGRDTSVCVLFQIDRREDPLILPRDKTPRPDYLAFYVDREHCICSIIELKGTTMEELKHGIEQIKELRDRLRSAVQEHLPRPLRGAIHYQGLLLAPVGANVPWPRIARECSGGLPILALQYHHHFELYPYVSQKYTDYKVRYRHQEAPRGPASFNLIEQILSSRARTDRIVDEFRRSRTARHAGKTGVYLNYSVIENGSNYAALSMTNDGGAIAFSSDAERRMVEKELRVRGVLPRRLEMLLIPHLASAGQ